jgi:hypothetical protein
MFGFGLNSFTNAKMSHELKLSDAERDDTIKIQNTTVFVWNANKRVSSIICLDQMLASSIFPIKNKEDIIVWRVRKKNKVSSLTLISPSRRTSPKLMKSAFAFQLLLQESCQKEKGMSRKGKCTGTVRAIIVFIAISMKKNLKL